MAPRKEKVEKTAPDQAADQILQYLRKQNRPYSATDVSANLKNKVTKAAAAKHLKDLHERNQIEGRTSGKQVVYHAIQEPADPTNDATIASLEATLGDLRTESGALNTQLRNLKIQLSALNTTLTTSQLHDTIATLSKEHDLLEKRLAPLRAGGGKPAMTKIEKSALVNKEQYWKTACERRAKIKREMWGLIRDALPEGMKEGDVAEQLGIED